MRARSYLDRQMLKHKTFNLSWDTQKIMTRKLENEVVEGLDHAFEFLLLLLSILFSIISLYTTTEEHLPLTMRDIRDLSLLLIFPTILIIFAWVSIHFTDDENWKMRLRIYCWASVLLLMVIHLSEFYIVCRGGLLTETVYWYDYIFILFASAGLLGVIPLWLINIVVNRYETGLQYSFFFTLKGKHRILNRYGPFVVSLLVFWLAYSLAHFL